VHCSGLLHLRESLRVSRYAHEHNQHKSHYTTLRKQSLVQYACHLPPTQATCVTPPHTAAVCLSVSDFATCYSPLRQIATISCSSTCEKLVPLGLLSRLELYRGVMMGATPVTDLASVFHHVPSTGMHTAPIGVRQRNECACWCFLVHGGTEAVTVLCSLPWRLNHSLVVTICAKQSVVSSTSCRAIFNSAALAWHVC
jgi:hypothetical protein